MEATSQSRHDMVGNHPCRDYSWVHSLLHFHRRQNCVSRFPLQYYLHITNTYLGTQETTLSTVVSLLLNYVFSGCNSVYWLGFILGWLS